MPGDPTQITPRGLPSQDSIRVGHYEILDEIGRGGMGIVYRARDLRLGRLVALKRPIPTEEVDPRQPRRFLREARAASRLAHPHIVPIFEVFEDQGVPWLAMELVDGPSLRTLLATGHPLPLDTLLPTAEGLASALEAAHGRHILHRDIKPSNVLIAPDGRAMLTDFGLARILRDEDPTLTRSRDSDHSAGQVVGTLAYMAPEQAMGREVDARTDIFSLGTVLYEMCTGEVAFVGTGAGIMDAILHHEPPAPSARNPRVPQELDRIIQKAMAKRPEARYQDARDLMADLRLLRQRLDFAAYAGGDVTSGGSRPRRVPVPKWVAAVLLMAMVAAWLWIQRQDRKELPGARLRIGVLMPQAAGKDSVAAAWPELVQALFVRDLTGVGGLAVVDPLRLNGIIENTLGPSAPRRGRALYDALREEKLSYVIDGMITPVQKGYQLHANLVAPSGDAVHSSFQAVVGDEDALAEAVAQACQSFISYLENEGAVVVRDKQLQPWLSGRPNVEALKAFLQYTKYAMRYEPGGGKYLERAIELDPSFVTARVWRIPSLVEAGQLAEARAHHAVLQKLAPRASPFEQAMIDWAGAYISGDRAAEVRHLESALEFAPGNNILLVNLAESRLETGDYRGTLDALEPLVRMGWRFSDVYTLEAAALVGLGRHAEAKRKLHEALEVSPAAPGVYGLLYALHLRDHEEEDAERYRGLYAARSQQFGADPPRQLDVLAGYLMDVGLPAEAAQLLERAVKLAPGDLDRQDRLGQALFDARRNEDAESLYARLLEEHPSFAKAHLMMARIGERRGRSKEAVLHYERFLASRPRGPEADEAQRRLEHLRSAQSPTP